MESEHTHQYLGDVAGQKTVPGPEAERCSLNIYTEQVPSNMNNSISSSITCYSSPKITLEGRFSRALFFHQPGIILETYKYGKIVLFQAILLTFSRKVAI